MKQKQQPKSTLKEINKKKKQGLSIDKITKSRFDYRQNNNVNANKEKIENQK